MKRIPIILILFLTTLTLTACTHNPLRPGGFFRPFVEAGKQVACTPENKAKVNVTIAHSPFCASASPIAAAICIAAQFAADKAITKQCPTVLLPVMPNVAGRESGEALDPEAELQRIYEMVGIPAEKARQNVAGLPRKE